MIFFRILELILDFQFTAVSSIDDGTDEISSRSRIDLSGDAGPCPPTIPKTSCISVHVLD